jgi:hypothetical protein
MTEGKLEKPAETAIPSELVKTKPVEATEANSPDEFADTTRQELEKAVIEKNAEIPQPESDDSDASPAIEADGEKPPVEKAEEPKEESAVDRIKRSVQKRIDKEVSKRKTLEEQLAEKEAELERLKTSKETPKEPAKGDKEEPTDAQVRAALKKAREDGDVEFEAQVLEYMVQRKANEIADARIKQIEERETSKVEEQKKIHASWISLNNDYMVYGDDGKPDAKHPMSLINQEGLLYTTAMSLYQDKELAPKFYADPDRIMGFRRAVADAYRELYQQGVYKPIKKEVAQPDGATPKRKPVLADPDADSSDEVTTPSSNQMSDADKVREEYKRRNQFHKQRMVA